MPKTDRSRPVTDRALERLSAWAARKPRVALMGEFSSGKSTLLNLLIGADLLPTRVTATELPPVWFSHGQPRAFWVDRQGHRHALDIGSFAGVPRSARCVRIFTPAPILERCDIIDTPGISDPNLEDESWRFPVGQANFVLWCTPATQAWRETERSTWLSLPERLRAQSLVVVTRADKLNALDREKVARRVSRETAGLFDGLLFLSSLDALRGQAERAETGDITLWQESGGAELAARLDLGVAAARAARAKLLRRYQLGEGSQAISRAQESEDPTPLRLVMPPEPVRPRRIERPETRRSERPQSETTPDPLDEIRAGWRALRTAEPPPEPAPVLRLGEPLPRTDLREEAPAPAWEARHLQSAEVPVPQPAQAEPEAVESLPDLAAEAAAALPPSDEAPPAETLPRAVRIWRDIVAGSTEIPPNSPIVAMIDQLLCQLSRDDQLSDGTGRDSATIITRNQAA